MRAGCPTLCLVLILALLATTGLGLDPDDKTPPFSPEQKKRLEKTRALGETAKERLASGHLDEAITTLLERLKIEREVLGEDGEAVIDTLAEIGGIYRDRQDYPKAREYWEKARVHCARRHGERHYTVKTIDVQLRYIEQLGRLSLEQRAKLRKSLELNDAAPEPDSTEAVRKAVGMLQEALEIRRSILGKEHEAVAVTLNNLAYTQSGGGFYPQAEVTHLEALAIRQRVYGEDHPETAESHNNLGHVLRLEGKLGEARRHLEKAVEIRENTFGKDSLEAAQSMNNLGLVLSQLGLYERAGDSYRRSLAIRRRHPENLLAVATACNNLGIFSYQIGDYVESRRYLEETLELLGHISKSDTRNRAATYNVLGVLLLAQGDYADALRYLKLSKAIHEQLGRDHPEAGLTLNTLGSALAELGRYGEARAEYEHALATFRAADDRVHVATTLHNLARLLEREGKLGDAIAQLEGVLKLRQAIYGGFHPEIAQTLNNLALMWEKAGELEKARDLLTRALAMSEDKLGPTHPTTANHLANLAAIDLHLGDRTAARKMLERALIISEFHMKLCFSSQSERQQLAMTASLRKKLDAYLSLAEADGIAAEDVYRHVVEWKGAVYARQRRRRSLRVAVEGEPLARELQETSATLAALALSQPNKVSHETWQREIQKLTDRKEHLERELSKRSAQYKAEQSLERYTVRELQAALPRDTALLDFLVYTRFTPPRGAGGSWSKEQRLTAFVVRPDSIARIELGPVSPIAKAVERWRTAVTTEDGSGAVEGEELARHLWRGLAKHLNGIRLVLVSPDGPLGRFPFGCLPGSRKGSYLIEEISIALIPIPKLLPEVFARERDTPAATASVGRLLLVSDVAYGAAPGMPLLTQAGRPSRSAPRGSSRLSFPPLLSTAEVGAVGSAYRLAFPKSPAPTELRQSGATESAFREAAPAHSFLHLQTHGFFGHEGLRSALDRPMAAVGRKADDSAVDPLDRLNTVVGYHPGLLSGVALAGANRGTQPLPDGSATTDDGILTALETAELDLTRTELVVLSACETGLGQEAAGEGLLGLQRAFQVAGSRTVVASLWKVDDEATSLLMMKFYKNIWENKIPVIEALRQAQLEVKLHGPGDSSHPKYWAAWVLSGNPGGRADRADGRGL
jgi:CHAT domain-containing protein/Tfp pilus assembly protein PilF